MPRISAHKSMFVNMLCLTVSGLVPVFFVSVWVMACVAYTISAPPILKVEGYTAVSLCTQCIRVACLSSLSSMSGTYRSRSFLRKRRILFIVTCKHHGTLNSNITAQRQHRHLTTITRTVAIMLSSWNVQPNKEIFWRKWKFNKCSSQPPAISFSLIFSRDARVGNSMELLRLF